MPLQIIRQDITRMHVDAIVNPSNEQLFPTGGTDLVIHNAAGPELLNECRKLGGCNVGQAKITAAFALPCKYVIHTVGPIWLGGTYGETEQLISCYIQCLELAKANLCDSLAFPLISAGTYGYPKDKVLKIAIDTISTFLFDNEMTVYLLVYDKKAYELSEKLFSGIKNYIDDKYNFRYTQSNRSVYNAAPCDPDDFYMAPIEACTAKRKKTDSVKTLFSRKSSAPKPSLDDFIKLDESFAVKLINLIDAKGISDVACYKKANVSKQTWHKLMTDKHYKPNKKTAISFAIALELSLDETQKLLSSVGFVLSDSSLFDVIIKYCLENKIYDVSEIDSALFKYDQETLFSTI